MLGIRAASDALLCRPQHSVIVVAVCRNIQKEVQHRVVVHKGRLDLDLAGRHGESVLAAALVGQLEFIAFAVLNGDGFQHIAAVGLNGDGHGIAALGVAGADGDAAVLCFVCTDGIAGIIVTAGRVRGT